MCVKGIEKEKKKTDRLILLLYKPFFFFVPCAYRHLITKDMLSSYLPCEIHRRERKKKAGGIIFFVNDAIVHKSTANDPIFQKVVSFLCSHRSDFFVLPLDGRQTLTYPIITLSLMVFIIISLGWRYLIKLNTDFFWKPTGAWGEIRHWPLLSKWTTSTKERPVIGGLIHRLNAWKKEDSTAKNDQPPFLTSPKVLNADMLVQRVEGKSVRHSILTIESGFYWSRCVKLRLSYRSDWMRYLHNLHDKR